MKEGENAPVYKDKLMIMKWKDRKDICFMCITHDDKMDLIGVQGQDMAKNKSSLFIYSGCIYREGSKHNNISPHTVMKQSETLSIGQVVCL
jgi:hypothetical protein